MTQIDVGIYVDKSEVCAVEDIKVWTHNSPLDNRLLSIEGSVIVLKNGKKIYSKLTSAQVIEKLAEKKV